MTRQNLTRWTCDSCGLTEERSTNEPNAPSGWIGVATNSVHPDGAWDDGEWRRLHLCPECRHSMPTLSWRQAHPA